MEGRMLACVAGTPLGALGPASTPQEHARLAARRLEHPTLHVGNLHRLVAPQAGSSNMHEWWVGRWGAHAVLAGAAGWAICFWVSAAGC